MKIYWSLNSVPEFTNIDSTMRNKAWRSCCYKSLRHWQIWAIEIFLIVAIIPTIQLYDFLERTYGMNLWVFVSVFTIYATVTTCISINIHIEFTRPYLKKYLDENNKNDKEKVS
jgi:hypothetical protein